MILDREATSAARPHIAARTAEWLRAGFGLIPLVALLVAPTALRADGDSATLRALAEGPLVVVEARSAAGSARLELRASDATIDQGILRWSHSESTVLRDSVSGREVGRVDRVSVVYGEESSIALGITVVAGPQATSFLVSSASLPLADLADARGRASAGFTLTEQTGDSGQVTGLNPDAQAYQAFYNDTSGPGTGSTFATLVSGLSTPTPYTSGTALEELPVGPGFSPNAENGAVLGTLTSISTQLHFQLSAEDAASASSVFAVEPSTPPAIVTLEASGVSGSASLTLALSELRSEDGARVWRSAEPTLLIDESTGAEIARLEPGSTAVVADETLSANFAATAPDQPVVFQFVISRPPFPAVLNAFGRVTAGLSVTDVNGDGAVFTGMADDNQAFQSHYNNPVGPGSGPTFATLIDGLSTPIPFSSAVTTAGFPGTGFSAVAEGGAPLGDVTNMSVRWRFELGAFDTATATSIFALHGGGTVSGRVYHDVDGNGTQDPGEPGLVGVDVLITDSQAGVWTVTTDANGDYSRAVPWGATTVDVDDTTLPAGAVQTEGTDPTVVAVPIGGEASDVDGYQIVPTVSTLEIPTLDILGLALLAICLGLGGAVLLFRRGARGSAG